MENCILFLSENKSFFLISVMLKNCIFFNSESTFSQRKCEEILIIFFVQILKFNRRLNHRSRYFGTSLFEVRYRIMKISFVINERSGPRGPRIQKLVDKVIQSCEKEKSRISFTHARGRFRIPVYKYRYINYRRKQ